MYQSRDLRDDVAIARRIAQLRELACSATDPILAARMIEIADGIEKRGPCIGASKGRSWS